MTQLSPYYPANKELPEVLDRLRQLPTHVSEDGLLDHVFYAAAKAEKLENFTPSFYLCRFSPFFEHATRNQMATALSFERSLHELEMAAACCTFAVHATGQQLRDLLERALAHCRRFDDITAEEERRLKRAEDRRHGGRARHARNDCARFRAARLILVMRPSCGWASPAQAARAIESRLVRFVKARGLSIVCEDNFRRTIVRWIKNHPAVRAAYLATCTAG